tara:strand:+ start:483 stop:1202 length:720 start_codon:yes stop_codon:yes gene_type:complete
MRIKNYILILIISSFNLFVLSCTKTESEGPPITDTSFQPLIVADFEDGIPQGSLVWNQTGLNMTFETASDNPFQGNRYFKMGGRVNWDYLLGQIDIPFQMPEINTVPENLFFNIAVLSGIDGEFDSDQFINIFISESNIPFNDDLSNNSADVFHDSLEVYKYQIKPIDWISWNMISISYDQFEIKGQIAGNNLKNPENITAVRIQCQSCAVNTGNCSGNANIDVRTDIDHIAFTENRGL